MKTGKAISKSTLCSHFLNRNGCIVVAFFTLVWVRALRDSGTSTPRIPQAYEFDGRRWPAPGLSSEKQCFWENGYVVLRGVFKRREMSHVRQVVLSLEHVRQRLSLLRQSQEKGFRPAFLSIFTWNDVTGDDIFSKMARNSKILDRLSEYYADDVYAYHNKVTVKYPGIVGFAPHQDFNYWHNFGTPFPESHAAWIAIDDATEDNGNLCVVPRSHLLGKLIHSEWPGGAHNTGVEETRYRKIVSIYGEVCPDMKSGDVIIFHGLTIHGSSDNRSNRTRFALVATMNTKKNSPIPSMNHPNHPYYTHQTRINDPIMSTDKSNLPNFSFVWPFPDENGTTFDSQQRTVEVPIRDYDFCSLYDAALRC